MARAAAQQVRSRVPMRRQTRLLVGWDRQFESPCILSDESQTREKLRRGRPCSPESLVPLDPDVFIGGLRDEMRRALQPFAHVFPQYSPCRPAHGPLLGVDSAFHA